MTNSKHVFVWKDFIEWKPVLEGMFPEILTADFIDKIQQNKSHIKYHDDPIFEELANKDMDSIITYKKIEYFKNHYSHVRFYHGCRTDDVQSYYRNGIITREDMKEIQIERFREIFLSGKFPELTEEMLQESIKLSHNPDQGSHFVLDYNSMIEWYPTYLINFGEYLCSLVANLPVEDKEKYYSELRKIGKPTFFEINLPINLIIDERIDKILKRMLGMWMYNTAHNQTIAGAFDLPYAIPKSLPHEYICSHFYPRIIRDPLMRKIYDAETGEYTEGDNK